MSRCSKHELKHHLSNAKPEALQKKIDDWYWLRGANVLLNKRLLRFASFIQ